MKKLLLAVVISMFVLLPGSVSAHPGHAYPESVDQSAVYTAEAPAASKQKNSTGLLLIVGASIIVLAFAVYPGLRRRKKQANIS